MNRLMRTIGEAAALGGVSVETLRYYDHLGLLKPRARSTSGYRLYGRDELIRLREILVWRQLGFPLQDVAALLDDPDHDHAEAVRRQRELVSEQHTRLGAILRGLESASAAIESGRQILDAELFDGFSTGPAAGDCDADLAGPIADRLNLLGGSRRLRNLEDPVGQLPYRRIVASDPIRLGENLLALGIVPVAVGQYFDTTSGELYCPWPDLVEGPIRAQVAPAGLYGSCTARIAAAQPDLILDLRSIGSGDPWSAKSSGGRCSYGQFREIAPTVLLESQLRPPGIIDLIDRLAAVLGLGHRAPSLAACWHARTGVIREHVRGQAVSTLNIYGYRIEDTMGLAATPRHEGQVFSDLELDLISPTDLDPDRYMGRAVLVTEANVHELSAPTLFMSVDDRQFAGPLQRFAREGRLGSLPAARSGRLFDLQWLDMASGWFTAHRQLHVVARAFGVYQLRTAGVEAPVHLAIAPTGKAALAPVADSGWTRLRGPGLPEISLELQAGEVATTDLGDLAADVCAFPEAYVLSTERSGSRHLMVDRESAVERLAAWEQRP